MLHAILYGLAGTVIGMSIAFAGSAQSTGPIVGIGVGLAVCAIEVWVLKTGSTYNGLFFVFTGQYIGAGLASRVWSFGSERVTTRGNYRKEVRSNQ